MEQFEYLSENPSAQLNGKFVMAIKNWRPARGKHHFVKKSFFFLTVNVNSI